MVLLIGHTVGEPAPNQLDVQLPSILRARIEVSMQEVQDFIHEVDLLFKKTRCTICSGPVIAHLDCKMMSRCGHVFHTECLELWEFSCAFKKEPFHCPDCHCDIVLFAKE